VQRNKSVRRWVADAAAIAAGFVVAVSVLLPAASAWRSGTALQVDEVAGEPAAAPSPAGPTVIVGEGGGDPPRSTVRPGLVSMQVDELHAGAGAAVRRGDVMWVHYQCKLPDGTLVFDSRTDRSERYGAGELRKMTAGIALPEGFGEGIIGQKPGSKFRLAIPAARAWGERGFAKYGIPPNSDLYFEVDVIHVGPEPAYGRSEA
jgi:FKBP-type peptidyl-prolyl cis-trans isomerase FkpA